MPLTQRKKIAAQLGSERGIRVLLHPAEFPDVYHVCICRNVAVEKGISDLDGRSETCWKAVTIAVDADDGMVRKTIEETVDRMMAAAKWPPKDTV